MSSKDFYFENDEFIIKNYDRKRTFSNFLPGIAGKKGIPMWAFYVNRGQGISSFGVKDKNSPILEFSPGYTAYQLVSRIGFRTFIKLNGDVKEIFAVEKDSDRTLKVRKDGFSITENNKELGIEVIVNYFGVPNDDYAGLVRRVTIVNLDNTAKDIEVIDGITQLLPTGVTNDTYKAMSNLARSWMEVTNLENKVGFYKMRSSTADSSDVKVVRDGNFYLSLVNGELTCPITDLNIIFGFDTSLSKPINFADKSVTELIKEEQITANKVPCGFTCYSTHLQPNSVDRIDTIIGNVNSVENLNSKINRIGNAEYFNKIDLESKVLLDDIIKEVNCETNHEIFDEYMKQNYLDNLLRGGYPIVFNNNDKNHVYHIYSRKHGDLERDYNFFSIAPEYYSQGNGNFRDVCQNRRNDVLFVPEVFDYNVYTFGNLIQLDGYNPLGVQGSTFTIKDKNKLSKIIESSFGNRKEIIESILTGEFTPGMVINTIEFENVEIKRDEDLILEEILAISEQNIKAVFGEGYWVDHFSYILDLVENFEAIYPDKTTELLFENSSYKYFESPVSVLPRSEKTVITSDKKIRRFGSIRHWDLEKVEKLGLDKEGTNWAKNSDGELLETNLYSKLFLLAFMKFTTLDPYGIGVEMEAEKPGWNDAMNGIPGLFGSGVSETIETLRIVKFLSKNSQQFVNKDIFLPKEFVKFMNDFNSLTNKDHTTYEYWNTVSSLREAYRDATRFGSESNDSLSVADIKDLLALMDEKLSNSVERATEIGEGIIPTFLIYEATEYKELNKIGNYGLPTVEVTKFELTKLPSYLEAPARVLKLHQNSDVKKELYKNIKASEIYDEQFKQYKTSAPLDDFGMEIGRARAFTKSWLERESNFLHMNYKYLLGLIKGGLYEEFYEEIKTNFVCFMDASVYGRSLLENSSFIALSNNPDKYIHGQGFVARLSGSTAEMLSIYNYMMMGAKPFVVNDENELQINFAPKLNKSFFKNDKVTFRFLGEIDVTYENKANKDTYANDAVINTYKVEYKDGKVETYSILKGNVAKDIRDKKVSKIICELN